MADTITGTTTIWELIERRAEASGDRPMLIDEQDRTLTFGQFRDRAERVAAGLHAMGVEAGTPVSWQLPTRIDTVVLCAALSRLGAVQNPIIHLYRDREVGFAVRQTGARFLAVQGEWKGFDFVELAKRVTADLADPPTLLVVDDGLPEGDPGSLPPAPTDEAVRWIYYTSGSTADPKGVRHTDRTLIAGGWGLAASLRLGHDDVGSMAFPFAHIAGPDYLVMMLSLSFPAVLVEQFVIADVLPFYRKHGVTMAGGATAFYVMFLTEQRKQPGEPVLPTLRMLTGGGGPKPPEIHYEVMQEIGGRGTVHGYGMTEVPMISNGSPGDTDEQLANTDGSPVEGCQVRIVTLDGRVAFPGEEGEIRVKGPMVFKGYTDPALNAEAFDEDGWFRTGDLGKLREDGHLCITGRVKDVIIRKGENISAREVEDILYRHPKVAEVAVIGLPDRERGEMVCAVVQPSAEGAPTLPEIADFCRGEGLMVQKIPERLELRDEMPRAGTGKIHKAKLKDEYA
jgi:cyclohexanecarboxylate-CoA ligase